MSDWLHRYKPAASARVHLFLAATLWTAVGCGLLFVGVRWALGWQVSRIPLLLGAAVAAGLLKSKLVLMRTAGDTIDRIRTRGDGRCLGGFLSPRTWAFVVMMMLCGFLLRHSPVPRGIVGLIYCAVGAALLVTTRVLWQAWYRQPRSVG